MPTDSNDQRVSESDGKSDKPESVRVRPRSGRSGVLMVLGYG